MGNMKVLVTGGAGYIGSFMTKRLLQEGYEVVVADSLERGHKEAVDSRAKLAVGNLQDTSFVKSLFSDHQFDAVIHFAGYIAMAESMEKPGMYFSNNTLPALIILEEMKKTKVEKIIFSSSAGVYGNPIKLPISEESPTHPTNPYGESKLMVEKILRWYNVSHGIRSVCLRYFNAAGAALDGSMGESHVPEETHIIPNAINKIINNGSFTLYGDTYNTKDGTCVRDYIHVLDLVEAHILSLKKLENKTHPLFYNVGTGDGYSNREVLDMVEKVSQKKLDVTLVAKREGDADALIADPTKIKNDLGFSPQYSSLETIVSSAWKWHSTHS